MKNKTLKQLVAQLKKHQNTIGKERDKIRELKEEIDSLLDPVEEGMMDLEAAIDRFSEQC